VEFIAPKENWEWGILENLQLAIILGILILSLYAFLNKKDQIQKWGFFLVSLFTIFVFLEEIDYGAHFVELIRGSNDSYLSKYTGLRNIHNQGNNAKLFKRSVYLVMALLFIVGPHLETKINNRYLSYLLLKPRITIIAVMAIFVDLLPRFIIKLEIRQDGGLGVNIGEFSEIIVYYIFFVYIIQLIFIKRLDIGTNESHFTTFAKCEQKIVE